MLFRTRFLVVLLLIVYMGNGVRSGNKNRNNIRSAQKSSHHTSSTRSRSSSVTITRTRTQVASGKRQSSNRGGSQIQLKTSSRFGALLNQVLTSLLSKPKTTPRPTLPTIVEVPQSDQLIRLGGNNEYYNVGRVEVYRAGSWGLVCDDRWDMRDAVVACRQLGFTRGAVRHHGKGNKTRTVSPDMTILMDEVNCQGSETGLQQCQYKTEHDCLLTESASVVCYPNQGCPLGWISGFGKCYKFFSKAKNIRLAAKTCTSQNASLLQIDSEAENHFLSNILQTTRKVAHSWWTAGKRTKGVWKWHKVIVSTPSSKSAKVKSTKSGKSARTTRSLQRSKSTSSSKSNKSKRTKSSKSSKSSKGTKSKKNKSSKSKKKDKKNKRRGKEKKKNKNKSRNNSNKARTKTIRKKISTEKWFPGWPSHGQAKAEPRTDAGFYCLVLTDEFEDPKNKKVNTDYFFWKAARCKQKGGINFICQTESEESVTPQAECYRGNGEDYRGYVQVTNSGSACLRWSDSQRVNPRNYPGKGLGNHNFCRNPDNDTGGPWCWVNHNTRTFGHCLIQPCTSPGQNTIVTTTVLPDLNCPDNEFYCDQERECVPGSYRCDNEQDCIYGEDEEGCVYMLEQFNRTKDSSLRMSSRRLKYTEETYLELTDELCAKACIGNTNFVCRSFIYDSVNRECNLSRHDSTVGRLVSSPDFHFYELVEGDNCSGQFQCSNGFCIESTQRCDGIDQCNDFSDEINCNDEDDHAVAVKLVGGDEHSGTVQLTYKGATGVVCDDDWGLEDANVVCRMLGYRGAAVFFMRNHFNYPTKDVTFMLDDVQCIGNETSIKECTHSQWKKHNCKAYAIAGVACQSAKACEDDQFRCLNGVCIEASSVCNRVNDCHGGSDEANCSTMQVRLIGGMNQWEGRIEITRNGLTGTICDDQWDDQDAAVICRMFGYRYGGSAIRSGQFGEGRGAIWLDNVNCRGYERSIRFCGHQGWGKHDCYHTEDAGVKCNRFPTTISITQPTTPTTTTSTTTTTTSTTTTTTTTRRPRTKRTTTTTPTTTIRTTAGGFALHLVGGSKPNEGNVEIVIKGRKYRICDDNWDNREANVICRSLGYPMGGIATGQSKYGVSNIPIVLDEVTCFGTERSLINCRALVGENKHDCTQGEIAGVKCNENVQKTTTEPNIVAPPVSVINASGTCGKRPYDTKDLFARKRRSSADDLHAPRTLAKPNMQKIIRGRTADHGAYPWQARIIQVFSVFRDGSYTGSHSCGGAIISEYWVLSAAHCFIKKRKSQFRIAVGDHHKKRTDKGEQLFSIEEIIMHNRYQEQSKDYDIALLKIQPKNGKGIIFNDYVQPACLPDAQTPYTDGQQCIISGWGSSEQGYPDSLKFAFVPLISWNKCRQLYDVRRTGFFSRRMLCAGYLQGGIDTCDGDSGGPLACNIGGSYILFGLTSWGRGCGQPNSPGVYAKVDTFLDWINKTIQLNSHTNQQKALPPKSNK